MNAFQRHTHIDIQDKANMCFCLQIAIKWLLYPVPKLPVLLDPVRATAHRKPELSQAVYTDGYRC